MASESSFLSQTLQSITTTKMREQNKRRSLFEAKKAKVLEAVEKETDPQARLEILLSGITDLSSSNKGISFVDVDRQSVSKNLTRYLEQSRRDSSVSLKLITTFDNNLRRRLEQDSRRFEFADLYYRLLGEWTSDKSTPLEMPKEVSGELDGSFEHVPKYDLDKLRDRFASVVFTPLDTNETEIDNYLSRLFEDHHAQKLLERIRESNASYGAHLKRHLTPFDKATIKQCIAALLNNNLLNDDAKQTLSDISTNDMVLEEIADVLNLRYADLDNWSWQAEDGMYYEPRRQINGKYRIMMDMDILQAIFLHYIAIQWCQQLKPIFSALPRDDKFWGADREMTDEQKQRHSFFLGARPSSRGRVNADKKSQYLQNYFLSSLPTSLSNGGGPYGEDSDDKDSSENDMNTGLGLRQAFLRQLAIDVLLYKSLEGEVAVVQSDLKWYATGLPHSTLFSVLRFWGIPEDWLNFFKKYAEAPLRMTETPGENVRTRRRGIPITDAFETLFGEAVLFCMDVAVNRLSRMSLIRFHDDIFLHGLPAQTAAAWQTIEEFVKVFGLDINTSKTGSVYLTDGEKDKDLEAKFPPGVVCMGMLQLTEDGRWEIDQKQVAAHTRQLQKQLGECHSIISWVQTWNSCMGRFFCDTFGQPANCFGQPHVEAILDTHANMQKRIFGGYGGSVANYLREQIKLRFSVVDVPDSFFFLPETLGGLGVKNPFVPFFLLKDQVIKDPNDRLKQFFAAETLAYKEASDAFSVLSKHDKKLRLGDLFGSSDQPELLSEPFFSFEEFTFQRRMYSRYLARAFQDLMLKPAVEGINISNEVAPWFEELRHTHEVGWHNLSNENRWIMHLYAEELKETFGALSIVDRNLLPSGVMKMLKKKKVPWQLIIWD